MHAGRQNEPLRALIAIIDTWFDTPRVAGTAMSGIRDQSAQRVPLALIAALVSRCRVLPSEIEIDSNCEKAIAILNNLAPVVERRLENRTRTFRSTNAYRMMMGARWNGYPDPPRRIAIGLERAGELSRELELLRALLVYRHDAPERLHLLLAATDITAAWRAIAFPRY